MIKKALSYYLKRFILSRQLKNLDPEIIPACSNNDESNSIQFSLNPLNADFIQDPYPFFQQLIKHEPLHRSQSGAWVISRYEDVINALSDPRFGNSPSKYATVHCKNSEQFSCANVANNILPFIDPPLHAQPRAAISRCFHQHLKNNPPALIEIADTLLLSLKHKPQFDLLHDFATPFTLKVFCAIMGFEQKDEQKLLGWSEWFLYLFTLIPTEEIRTKLDTALNEFRHYIQQQIERHKNSDDDSFLSALLKISEQDQKLTQQQIIDNCMLLFADGIGNSDKAICSAFVCLKNHPQQLKLLQQNNQLLGAAVNETLRYESAAQYIGRVAKQDIELHDQIIKQNETILLMLGAANRDPNHFANAQSFTIQRSEAHISFGKSRHSCIGAPLVRDEIEAALKALLKHIDNIDIQPNQPLWDTRPGHRWIKQCLVSQAIA